MASKVLISICVLILAVGAFGQTTSTAPPAPLPANFAAAGGGFQGTGNPQASGWAEGCHRNPDAPIFGLLLPSYLCLATDYSGTATSARADVDTVLLHRGWFTAGTKTGGGAAYNANGVGGSFAGGGWMTIKMGSIYVAASATWRKDDVVAAVQNKAAPVVLRALKDTAVFRIGFGMAW